jgi:hypothetical protein
MVVENSLIEDISTTLRYRFNALHCAQGDVVVDHRQFEWSTDDFVGT